MRSQFKPFSIVLAVALALVLCVSAVGSAGAEATVAREDTVIFDLGNISTNPTNFNLLVPPLTKLGQGAHQAMWEPLFILNYITGKIDPYLGTAFTSNSALDVWTLTLRDGVKWSDGVAFSADDVVFTINTLLTNKAQTLIFAAEMQHWVKAVKKIDVRTVEFDLNLPNPRFQLDYFSVRVFFSLNILPAHVWQGQDPTTFTFYDPSKGWPIGTGPYKLTSASPTQFVWDEDPNWWGAATGFHPLPVPKRLIWVLTHSEQSRALLISQHQLDSAADVTLGAFRAIQTKNPNVIAWKDALPYAFADPCPRELEFQTEQAPWSDPNLRKAVSLIIDRDQNVKIAYQGTTTPSSTMFVSYGSMQPFIDAITTANEGLDEVGHIADGQKLIEAAGYKLDSSGIYEKDGKTLDLNIIVPHDSQEYTLSNNELVEQLQRAGINASSQPLNGATQLNASLTGNFQAQWAWDTCGSVNEPWASMNTLNVSYYKPVGTLASGDVERWNTAGAKAYSTFVDQIGSLPLGDPSIPGLVAQAYKYINDEAPVIPLVQAEKLVPFDTTYWTNWPTAKNDYTVPTTWCQNTFVILFNLKKAAARP
ncbi:MAG: ABC transporter substrate-binding protein [Aggregatilineales bacterium]